MRNNCDNVDKKLIESCLSVLKENGTFLLRLLSKIGIFFMPLKS